MGRLGGVLGKSWRDLGGREGVCKRLGAILGLSEAAWGGSGGSGRRPWGVLGASQGSLGATLGGMRASRRRLGRALGASWELRGAPWSSRGPGFEEAWVRKLFLTTVSRIVAILVVPQEVRRLFLPTVSRIVAILVVPQAGSKAVFADSLEDRSDFGGFAGRFEGCFCRQSRGS